MARIRAAHAAVASTIPSVRAWVQDSLNAPREAVESRHWMLRGILRSGREPAARLYEAAWLLDTLARTYGPAVHQSGLLDSSRVVRLQAVADQFIHEVEAIPPCTSVEVATWRSDVTIAAGTLAEARAEMTAVRRAIQMLDELAREAWATAQHPGNFYFVQVIGPYSRATDVIVTLHHLPLDPARDEPLSTENMAFQWALYFHDGPADGRSLTTLRRAMVPRRVATPSPTARSGTPR